jgi:hypothetical protein
MEEGKTSYQKQSHTLEMEEEWFWELIREKQPYFTRLYEGLAPKLFQASSASGVFDVEEIYDYCQDDLNIEDVMILVTMDTIFVWEGPKAVKEEKKESLKVLKKILFLLISSLRLTT